MSRLALDAELAEAVQQLLTTSPLTSGLGLLVKLVAAPTLDLIQDIADGDIVTAVYPSEYSVESESRDGDRHEISVGVTLIRRAPNTFEAAKAMMVVAANVRAALTRRHLVLGQDAAGNNILAEWQAATSDKSIEHDALRSTQCIVMIHISARYSVFTTDNDQE